MTTASDHTKQMELIEELEMEVEHTRRLTSKLAIIEQMARRHASPSSNPGAHALAAAIVRICEEK